MSIFTYQGRVVVEAELDADRLPGHLADQLRRVRADDVVVERNVITFRGGIVRLVSSWNVLVPFGWGKLIAQTERNKISYTVSYAQLFVFATLFGLGADILIFSDKGAFAFPALVVPPVIAWCWFVGGNLAIGIPRFNAFLKKAAASAPRTLIPS